MGLIFKDAQGNITKEAHYRYDVNNRRIEKVVDLDGAGSGLVTTEGFVYDGAHSVLVFDGAGSLTSRYLFGPEVNQVLAEERVDGNPSVQNNLVIWAFGDHLGTVRDTLASSGRELNHLVIDSYGNITSESNLWVSKTSSGWRRGDLWASKKIYGSERRVSRGVFVHKFADFSP